MRRVILGFFVVGIALLGLQATTGCANMSAGYYGSEYGSSYNYSYGYDPYHYDGTMPPGDHYSGFNGRPY